MIDLSTDAPADVKVLVRYFNERNYNINNNYATACALMLLSFLKNRNFVYDNDTFANLYLGVLGATASGKTLMTNKVFKLLKFAGIKAKISAVESKSAFGRELELKESRGVLNLDEFQKYLSNSGHKNAAGHRLGMKRFLLSAYTATSEDEFQIFSYANKKVNSDIVLHHPFISVFGNTTKNKIEEVFNHESASDGFLNRFIFIDGDGHGQVNLEEMPTEDYPIEVRKIVEPYAKDFYQPFKPRKMRVQSEAMKFINNERLKFHDIKDELERSVRAREVLNAIKLSMTIARATIKLEHVEWAWQLVQESSKACFEMLEAGEMNYLKAQVELGEIKTARSKIIASIKIRQPEASKMADIINSTCISKTTVRRHLRLLEQEGILLKQYQTNPNGGSDISFYKMS